MIGMQSIRVRRVIETKVNVGDGSQSNPIRILTQYWSDADEPELLATVPDDLTRTGMVKESLKNASGGAVQHAQHDHIDAMLEAFYHYNESRRERMKAALRALALKIAGGGDDAAILAASNVYENNMQHGYEGNVLTRPCRRYLLALAQGT